MFNVLYLRGTPVVQQRRDSLVKQGMTTGDGKLRRSSSESAVGLKRLEIEQENKEAQYMQFTGTEDSREADDTDHVADGTDPRYNWADPNTNTYEWDDIAEHDGYHDDHLPRFHANLAAASGTARRATALL
ncbi:hypothetical protein SARC_00738 [Sphaeroforma arctica JP610]|uniref:Uncharacterized protein n=1 Tax=Sphaeroforma arctica JP610 TaxID=667725 RepID=A0A0L0GDN8_9EUKA|nr:hypothetical protein SARC_00738 [Sphaeroforma arctica JP610]KNC87115.1 hypothetical protein SARC_00738 [Sphaeroforma arctica JP610]|eukprot:XP_014161017.1 hypothetical protein SARC_00738 [Sphaeroforma arctica JP610]